MTFIGWIRGQLRDRNPRNHATPGADVSPCGHGSGADDGARCPTPLFTVTRALAAWREQLLRNSADPAILEPCHAHLEPRPPRPPGPRDQRASRRRAVPGLEARLPGPGHQRRSVTRCSCTTWRRAGASSSAASSTSPRRRRAASRACSRGTASRGNRSRAVRPEPSRRWSRGTTAPARRSTPAARSSRAGATAWRAGTARAGRRSARARTDRSTPWRCSTTARAARSTPAASSTSAGGQTTGRVARWNGTTLVGARHRAGDRSEQLGPRAGGVRRRHGSRAVRRRRVHAESAEPAPAASRSGTARAGPRSDWA